MNDTGGSAFPMPDQYTPDGNPIMQGSTGMTLRDWFAGQALAGMISDQLDAAPDYAYWIADRMLEERRRVIRYEERNENET